MTDIFGRLRNTKLLYPMFFVFIFSVSPLSLAANNKMKTLAIVSIFSETGMSLTDQKRTKSWHRTSKTNQIIIKTDPEILEKQLVLSATNKLERLNRYIIVGDISRSLNKPALRYFLQPNSIKHFPIPLIERLAKSATGTADYILAIIPSNGKFKAKESDVWLYPYGQGMIYYSDGNIAAFSAYGLVLIDVKNKKIVASHETQSSKPYSLKKPAALLSLKQRETILMLVNDDIALMRNKLSLSDIPANRPFTRNDIDHYKSLVSKQESDLSILEEYLPDTTHHTIEEFATLPNKDVAVFVNDVKSTIETSMSAALEGLFVSLSTTEEDSEDEF